MSSGFKRTKGSTAVMTRRAPAEVEQDTEEQALFRTLDYYPTPPWAARAGAEVLQKLDPLARSVWEPACGKGHMAHALREYFPEVRASDIHAHGYGEVLDFMDPHLEVTDRPDWIFTNPPFKSAETFVRLAMERARRGVAMLCRIQFVETEVRYPLMRKLALQATFAERVPMALGRWDPKLSSASCYAIFYWMHPDAEEETPFAEAIRASRLLGASPATLIPPGTKRRLWRADDPKIWGWSEEGALLAYGEEQEACKLAGVGS